MPNKIPQSTRQRVYERADRRCELTGRKDRLSIHHIIPRRHRNHREEALILLCGAMHDLCENFRGKNSLHNQLRLALQEMYLEFHPEKKVRKLLGGRLFIGEVTRPDVKYHFQKIKERYSEENS